MILAELGFLGKSLVGHEISSQKIKKKIQKIQKNSKKKKKRTILIKI